MAVPDYQTLMRPLLQFASDGQEHTHGESIDTLANHFRLSEDERRELIPSGGEARFDNRVGWARTYLSKAGLLESTGRARFRITQRGLEVLATHPHTISNKTLEQFPEYLDFKRRAPRNSTTPQSTDHDLIDSVAESTQTPQETLETSYQLLRRNLVQELLEKVKGIPPRFFERLVVDVLVSMGYGGSRRDAGQAIGRSGDDGIDGIIKEDRLGLDVVYIQAKRWEGTVGRPVVQAFAGSLEGHRARKGVLITTSQFSSDAKDYVNRIEKKIVLIDGEQLTQMMIDYGVGVTEVASYTVKKLDSDYFGE
jgi:restriction system protein